MVPVEIDKADLFAAVMAQMSEKTDLFPVWLELTDQLRAKGIVVEMPAYLGYATGREDLPDMFGGWLPQNGHMYIADEIAGATLLVRDALTHEITHQLQSQSLKKHPGIERGRGGPHGPLFRDCACRVAKALRCPFPVNPSADWWPIAERPEGFYGPFEMRRS